MIMRLPNIGSQYIWAFAGAAKNYLDGAKTYKVTLPPNIPAAKFWSLTLYDNQTRSMLHTPQLFPRAGSQSYPTPAAAANPDGSTTVYSAPAKRTVEEVAARLRVGSVNVVPTFPRGTVSAKSLTHAHGNESKTTTRTWLMTVTNFKG